VRKKRSFFTLLELLIGLTLSIALLTTLSYFYREIDWLGRKGEQLQKENFQMRYLQNRLAQILPFTLSENDLKKEFYFFYTSGDLHNLLAPNLPSLVFVFDSGPSLDTQRAHHSLGRLYVDKQNQLILATWSSPEMWKTQQPSSIHKEILLDHVKGLSFHFYNPPERDRSKIKEQLPQQKIPNSEEPDRKGEWLSEWRQEYGFLPTMIKVHLVREALAGKEEKVTYAFPLPRSSKLIVYEEGS